MRNELPTVGYDPIYNFHSGYHNEVIESTKTDIHWSPTRVINHFEEAVISSDHAVRKTFISSGEFQVDKDKCLDWLFSPHILVTNEDITLPPIFMELEDFPWLFADTYDEVVDEVNPAKIAHFEFSMMNPRLKHILWWSNAALERFFGFASFYKISIQAQDRVASLSQVVYPSAPILARREMNTERNAFCAVFNHENFFRKGGDVVLSTFSKIQREIKDWSLTIVGDVPNSHTSLVSENVTIIPPTSRDKLQEVFLRTNTFLLPTRADTFGTVLIEAINTNCYIVSSSGKSVIASQECLDNYPNSTVIPSYENDGVYDVVDSDGFYEVVRDMLRNPRQLVQYSSPYNREVMRNKILNILTNNQ